LTLDAPLYLLTLCALPVAWWIRRMRTGAPVVRVASLLAFRGAGDASPSSAPRRATDVPFALTLTAMALLAVAAAGPSFGASGTASAYVVVDRSVSMTARTCDADRRVDLVLQTASPGATAVRHDLIGAADGLPGSLAEHLALARREGYAGIVVATDASFDAVAGVACVGPSRGAEANASVAGVALEGDEAVVSLRNHGRADVTIVARSGSDERAGVVPAGGVASVRFAAPARGMRAVYEIASPRDDLAADDRAEAVRLGGVSAVTFAGGESACPRLAAAVRAACGKAGAAPDGGVVVSYRGPPDSEDERPRLVVAPPASSAGAIRATSSPRTVRGDEIVGHGAAAEVLPGSGVSLVATGTLSGGEALWSTVDGVLLARAPRLAVLAVDPEDARSDWHRDPSFPVLLAAALEALADGPDRLEASSPVAASESDVVRPPRPTSSPEEIAALVRAAADAPGNRRSAPWIAALGALLLAVAAALSRR
jgi:hypothetical protein